MKNNQLKMEKQKYFCHFIDKDHKHNDEYDTTF